MSSLLKRILRETNWADETGYGSYQNPNVRRRARRRRARGRGHDSSRSATPGGISKKTSFQDRNRTETPEEEEKRLEREAKAQKKLERGTQGNLFGGQ